MSPYCFESRGRSRRSALALALIWGTLSLLIWLIDLSRWIAAALFAFTLPAAWEFLRDRRASLRLDDAALTWHAPTQDDSVPLRLISTIRFDTRFDLSVRITLILHDTRKLRLPHACTPPHQRFEDELTARAIATERHHFALFG